MVNAIEEQPYSKISILTIKSISLNITSVDVLVSYQVFVSVSVLWRWEHKKTWKGM